jgi:hypothetical protein
MPAIAKHAIVEDSNDDEEPGYVGEMLNPDGDIVIEPCGDAYETDNMGSMGDPIEIDSKDEDSKISEPTVTAIMF